MLIGILFLRIYLEKSNSNSKRAFYSFLVLMTKLSKSQLPLPQNSYLRHLYGISKQVDFVVKFTIFFVFFLHSPISTGCDYKLFQQ